MAMKDNTSEFAARRSRMVKQQFDRHGPALACRC